LLGRSGEVVEEAVALAAHHPFREELHLLHARALYRRGRQVDALRTLQQLAHRLRAELGVEPSPAVRDLEAAILVHDPSLGGPPGVPPTSTVTSEPNVKVGDPTVHVARRHRRSCRHRRSSSWRQSR
jgi:DNA-binding SARP family transcriptional activator